MAQQPLTVEEYRRRRQQRLPQPAQPVTAQPGQPKRLTLEDYKARKAGQPAPAQRRTVPPDGGPIVRRPPRPRLPGDEPGFFEDQFNLAKAGLVSLVGAGAEALGNKELGSELREQSEAYRDILSTAQKQASEASFLSLEGITSPRKIIGGLSESLPALGVGVLGGIAAAPALGAAGLSPALAGALGFGAAEGVTSGVLAGSEVADRIKKIPQETLNQSPEFQRLRSIGMTPKEARETISDRAASQARWQVGSISALLGFGPGALLGKALRGSGVAATRLGATGRIAGAESAQEAAQGTAEAGLSNIAVGRADPNQAALEGTLESAVGGAVLGGIVGGGLGAATFNPNRLPGAQPPPEPEIDSAERIALPQTPAQLRAGLETEQIPRVGVLRRPEEISLSERDRLTPRQLAELKARQDARLAEEAGEGTQEIPSIPSGPSTAPVQTGEGTEVIPTAPEAAPATGPVTTGTEQAVPAAPAAEVSAEQPVQPEATPLALPKNSQEHEEFLRDVIAVMRGKESPEFWPDQGAVQAEAQRRLDAIDPEDKKARRKLLKGTEDEWNQAKENAQRERDEGITIAPDIPGLEPEAPAQTTAEDEVVRTLPEIEPISQEQVENLETDNDIEVQTDAPSEQRPTTQEVPGEGNQTQAQENQTPVADTGQYAALAPAVLRERLNLRAAGARAKPEVSKVIPGAKAVKTDKGFVIEDENGVQYGRGKNAGEAWNATLGNLVRGAEVALNQPKGSIKSQVAEQTDESESPDVAELEGRNQPTLEVQQNADTPQIQPPGEAQVQAQVSSATAETGQPATLPPAPPVLNTHIQQNRPNWIGFDLPDESLRMRLSRWFIDQYKRFSVVRDTLIEKGGRVTEESDVARMAELFRDRAGARIDSFNRDFVRPLLTRIANSSVTMDELNAYLYAKHAPERNQHIDEINPMFRDQGLFGSGMATHHAAELLRRFDRQGKTQALEELAQEVRRMNKERIELLRREGLVEPEQLELWEQKYRNYVPLRGEDGVDGIGKIGKGFQVRGPESFRALGRRSMAISPVAQTILQMQESILRAERNRVGSALKKLIEDNPDPLLWNIHENGRAFTKRVFDQKSREVVFRKDPLFKDRDDVVSFKENGREFYVELNDPLLARAFKNLDGSSANALIRGMGSVTRFLARINTQFSPPFILTNLIRDAQTAGVNLAGILETHPELRGQDINIRQEVMGILRNATSAGNGIRIALRNRDPNPQFRNEWAREFEEFRKEGGPISFFGLEDLDVKMRQINRDIRLARKGKLAATERVFRDVFEVISDYNGAVENAIRLSTYKRMKELGLSNAEAASLAKNLTVNFNRRGELGVAMNAFYLFYNAGIQGTVRLLQAAGSSPLVRKILAGVAGGAASLTALNYLAGGVDDDGEYHYNKVPNWIRERNLVIMSPLGDGSYMKIPLPYGYNIPHVIGESIMTSIIGGQSIPRAGANILNAAIGSFNPLGNDESAEAVNYIAKLATPTIGDPFLQLALNENFAGNPIMPEQPTFGAERPDSQLYFNSVRKPSKAIANWLNTMTGGNTITPGGLDVSPESIDFWTDWATGGAGRFVMNAIDTPAKLFSDDELKVKNIPFLRSFASGPSEFFTGITYRERANEMRRIDQELKLQRRLGRSQDDIRREFGGQVRVLSAFKSTEGQLRKLYDTRKNLQIRLLRGDPEEPIQKRLEQINDRIQETQMRFNAKYNIATK